MGSAAVAALAQRGCRVLGLERYARGHDRGSSSGRSRMIRKAYYEDPAYVPLVLRAYAAWEALEARTGLQILQRTGVLMIGNDRSAAITGARESARVHGLALESLDARQARRRFPAFAVRDDETVLFEPDGGMLFPERAIEAQLTVAQEAGAELRFETRATAWGASAHDGALAIELEDGTTVRASRLILCAGPWTDAIAGAWSVPLSVRRTVQHWFAPRSPRTRAGTMPAFFVDRPDWAHPLYGFPDSGEGIKAAFHGSDETSAADALDREVRATDIGPVREALETLVPGEIGAYRFGKVCMYTMTPDEHFVIGPHPSDARVIAACGFSGHGFKFASALGEILADLALEGGTDADIALFSPARRFR